MRAVLFLTIALMIPYELLSQKDSTRGWEVSTAFSFGSANNVGDPGLILTSNYEYYFHQNLSVSAQAGFFHSFLTVNDYGLQNPIYINTFSAITAGIYLNHTARFNQNRNFVKVSAGPAYFHSISIYQDDAFNQSPYTHYDVASRLGFGLSMEGGGKVSEKVSLGLVLIVYSYYIFGDITVLGVNAHFNMR